MDEKVIKQERLNTWLHPSVWKMLKEIVGIFKFSGTRKLKQEDHVQFAIKTYGKALRTKKVVAGEDIEKRLGI